MELDLGAVRAFVAIVEHRHFGEAASRLGISQQAISKRVAKLESDLGATLFRRSRSGAALSEDGEAFLTHARTLIDLADLATESVRRRRRPLRVDVLGTRLASAELLRDFYRQAGDIDIDIVTSIGFRSAHPALLRGSVDAAFARAVGTLDEAIAQSPAFLEPLYLLVGRDHRLAGRKQVRPAELSGLTVWMPGNVPNREWTEFYEDLSTEFDIRIDSSGPNFGIEYLLEEVGRARGRISFVGDKTPLGAQNPRVVRIPITRPTPVYPTSLLWRRDNPHPALPRLIAYVSANYRPADPREVWLPAADRAVLGMEDGT